MHVQKGLVAGARRPQDFKLQKPQFPIGDNQKVSTAAGRVKEIEPPQSFMKLEKSVFVVLDLLELFPQRIQEERFDQLENVFFAGVVRAKVSPCLLVHDGLEKRTENGGRDAAPIQRTAVQQLLAHGGVKARRRQKLFKEFAVDIGKRGQLLVQIFQAFFARCVENLKQRAEMIGKVGAVFPGAFFEVFFKLLFFKYAGIFGKQAKQQADQINFQRMAGVARVFHPVVEFAHLFGGPDVDRVLCLNFMCLVSGNKTEKPHVLMQVFQLKFMLLIFFQIVETNTGKVGNNDVFGQVAFFKSLKIIKRLIIGFVEAFSA